MANIISNSDDLIDSRDVIARIEELQSECEDRGGEMVHPDGESQDELKALLALQAEAEGYAPDWKYGACLIRRSYFVEYCEELCKDIGDLPKEIPHYIEIDWKATARNIEIDYTSVDFDGTEYLVR